MAAFNFPACSFSADIYQFVADAVLQQRGRQIEPFRISYDLSDAPTVKGANEIVRLHPIVSTILVAQ
jgi:hypothetical protein